MKKLFTLLFSVILFCTAAQAGCGLNYYGKVYHEENVVSSFSLQNLPDTIFIYPEDSVNLSFHADLHCASVISWTRLYFNGMLIDEGLNTGGIGYKFNRTVMDTGEYVFSTGGGPGHTFQLVYYTNTAVKNPSSAFSAIAFPNPFQNEFQISISSPNASEISYNIYDGYGRLVRSYISEQKNDELHTAESMEHLAKGIYFVNIMVGNKNEWLKVVSY